MIIKIQISLAQDHQVSDPQSSLSLFLDNFDDKSGFQPINQNPTFLYPLLSSEIGLKHLSDYPKAPLPCNIKLLLHKPQGEVMHDSSQLSLRIYLTSVVPSHRSKASLLPVFSHPKILLQLVAEVVAILQGLKILQRVHEVFPSQLDDYEGRIKWVEVKQVQLCDWAWVKSLSQQGRSKEGKVSCRYLALDSQPKQIIKLSFLIVAWLQQFLIVANYFKKRLNFIRQLLLHQPLNGLIRNDK